MSSGQTAARIPLDVAEREMRVSARLSLCSSFRQLAMVDRVSRGYGRGKDKRRGIKRGWNVRGGT